MAATTKTGRRRSGQSSKAKTRTARTSARPKPDLRLGWPKAYPMKYHRKCQEITRKDVSYDPELKLPPTEGLQFRLDSGIAFEDQVGADIAAAAAANDLSFVHIVLDRTARGRSAAEKATLAAMRDGVEVIWNGRLATPKSHKRHLSVPSPFGGDVTVELAGSVGEPDMLVLVNGDDVADGVDTPRYAAVDVKWHRSFEGATKARDWPVSEFSAPFPSAAGVLTSKGYPQLDDSLQLVHYQEMLDHFGFGSDLRVGGIIGKELKVLWVDFDEANYSRTVDGRRIRVSAQDVYDDLQREHTAVTVHELLRDGDDSITPITRPERKTACMECPWREVCHDELVEENHISLLPGVTPSRLGPHYAAGVSTIPRLARLDYRAAELIDAGIDLAAIVEAAEGRSSTASVSELASHQDAQALRAAGFRNAGDLTELDPVTLRYSGTGVKRLPKAIDQARVWQSGKIHRARGVSHVRVPMPAVVVHNDIEDTGGDFCYMIGNHVTIRRRGKVESQYKAFVTWERDPRSEAQVFADFWTWLSGLRAWARKSKVGGFVAYHYTDHETRFYRHLATKHAGFPGVPTLDELDEFLNSSAWVDLYKIVIDQLIWPTKDHTVKRLAQAVGFTWRDDNPSGAASAAWAQIAMDDPDPQLREEMRERLLAYNEDDVLATDALVTWLHRNSTQARRPGTSIPEVSALDRRFQPRRRRR